MEKTANLIIVRNGKGYTDMLRLYKVYIDNEFVGNVAARDYLELEIKPGMHKIYLKIDWQKTKEITINIDEGKRLYLETGSLVKGGIDVLFRGFSKGKYIYVDYLVVPELLVKGEQKEIEGNEEEQKKILEIVLGETARATNYDRSIKRRLNKETITTIITMSIVFFICSFRANEHIIFRLIFSIIEGIVFGGILHIIWKSLYKKAEKRL